MVTGVAWDNGTRGNFWGDYTTQNPYASSLDRITWGSPYMIAGGSCRDQFPLYYPSFFTVPGQVLSPTITSLPGLVHVSWTAPLDGGLPITAYHVHRNDVLIHSTNSTVTNWTDTTVVAGSTYVYTVTAENDLSHGRYSETLTGFTVPGQVTGLVAEVENGFVMLSWDAPADGGVVITSYKIYRDDVHVHTTGWGVTSWINYELASGQQYVYFVVAMNAVGDGAPSDHVETMLDAEPDPAQPPPIPGYDTWLVGIVSVAMLAAVVATVTRRRS